MSRISTGNFVAHFDPAKNHHRAWLQFVLNRLEQYEPDALQRGSESYAIWQSAVEQKEPLIAPAPQLREPTWLAPARRIVSEYEGCRLTAYKCPAGVWTVGYGHTGPDVTEGLTITQQQADAWLTEDLQKFGAGVDRLLQGAALLGANQKAALVSFAFNIGLGALEDSTLRKRIAAGESYIAVVPQELPRWNKAGNTVLPGLVRRRHAEVELFMGRTNAKSNPLPVPWFAQLDSSTDQARRMCFSSSCAMLLAYLRPGVLTGANGDDQYLRRVQQFGDTTSHIAQIRALASYGVNAEFTRRADFRLLERQIDAGIPVPCGYLHRGPLNAPAGGGHWLIVVGYDATHLYVHDPLGEAALTSGTTLNKPARFARYSRDGFGRRWMVDETRGNAYSPGNGWAIIAKPG